MFELMNFEVAVRGNLNKCSETEAKIKIRTNKGIKYEVADGNGLVNALDKVLRKALLPEYPFLEKVRLIDYQAFISKREQGTGFVVNVVIVSSDGKNRWTSQRESPNIIEASLWALIDSFTNRLS